VTTPVLFLLGAVALSALGGMGVWIASRPRPEKFGSSIETFSRDLDALAPPGTRPSPTRPSSSKRPQFPARKSAPPAARGVPQAGNPSSAEKPQPKNVAPGPRPKPGPRPQTRR